MICQITYFSPLHFTFHNYGHQNAIEKKFLFHIVSKGTLGNDDFTFPKNFFLKITKQHTASLISTLNTGETNKIKLANYFILRMRVFIQNFTYGEKGVKCCGKKFTYPKC